jgi:hypothetical protein
MAITMLRHPLCAGQVTIERTSSAVVLELWIDVENDLRHLAPVGSLRVCIEHAQISNDMLFVVDREHRIRWRKVGNVRICRWLFHERFIKRMILIPADLKDLL